MIPSLYTGVSGIQANGIAMGVIGNNIANVTTPGYKASRALFEDIISRSLTGTSKISQVGRGVLTQSIQMLFSQSSFETTNNPTDLAIDGNGFFVLIDQNGKYYYTRAGTFIIDKNSKLVNPNGLVVQGWEVDSEGRAKGVLKDIDLSRAVSTARKTENISLGLNLDADDDVRFHITDWNNTLIVDGTTIEITTGTYTGETLADQIERQLQAEGINIKVSYNSISGKFKFENTDAAAHTLEFSDANSTIESVLGFNSTDVTINAGSSTESDHLPDVSGRIFKVVSGVNDKVVVGGTTVTLTAGTYTGHELAQHLYDAINTQVGAGTVTSVTYDPSEGIFTVDSGPNTINWGDANSTAAPLFGFNTDHQGSASSDTYPWVEYDIDVYNYSTSLTIYDSVGAPHVVTFYFRKVSANEWEWHMTIDGGELLYKTDNGSFYFDSGTPIDVGMGRVIFSNSGALQEERQEKDILLTFSNGSEENQEVTIDFGESTAEGGTGLLGTTQFAAPSATFTMTQDGYTSGSLQTVQIDVNGVIYGLFTNGVIKPLAQIALATFDSPWGLAKEGGNLYSETTESGQPNIGAPNRAGKGKIISNSIEQSNVDLANEFVKMIVTQRAFQANARVITTSDYVLNEVVNLKR